MSFKNIALIGCAAWLAYASPALAWTTQSTPVDSKGVAYSDPDEKADSNSTNSNGVTVMHFGDSDDQNSGGMNFSFTSQNSGSSGSGQSNTVQTGNQMYDPGLQMMRR